MSSETRALLENSLWAAAQPRGHRIRRSKLAGHPMRRRAVIQPTTLMVSSPYRGPLSTLPMPWGTIQLGNFAFPSQRYSFSVILDQFFFHSGHIVHMSMCFQISARKQSFSDGSKVFPLLGSWSLMFPSPTSSCHWWSYFSSVILQNWKLRWLFIDPLYHFYCAAPSLWGGIYLVYLLPSLGWVSPQPCWMQRPLSRLRVVCSQSWHQGWARHVLLFLAISNTPQIKKKKK